MPLQNIIGLSREELITHFQAHQIPKFRVQQVWNWVYHHGVTNFDRMLNISAAMRQQLQEVFVIERPQIATSQVSNDGTQKWLLRFNDNQEAETVHIPEVDRGTLCVSSQIGCTLTCKFCHTGTQTLVRNLTSAEIVGQMMVARDVFGEWPSPVGNRHVSNIVMMGMGEPLYNYENVKKALLIIMDNEGICLSRRRITLSTSGVVPMMQRCGEEIGVNLAVSLHAVRNDVRDHLVPLNKKYPVEDLLDACRHYPGASNSRRITFEYVMLKDVNDSNADAKELLRLIRGIPAKINLIPFNPWPGSTFECSSAMRIEEFASIIQRAGYPSPVRTPRGQDILAACGQLKSASERQRKSKLVEAGTPMAAA
ncbi:23S rRNA (adenine(2503)-C(2))-methyltransferase RlmN [Candidatus Finniella inopinata]|uniref:Dual-specificity RNA methyltransferase RlmN n=1 Tax=Candidatus Finniella inopinata TaxID=1696036 RepID=A0A4V2DZS6_9PROT|nr:23S rRNA (adenine(2503)-C(2))-methyltransferase RlmN [Candidatus Finniella inopinata]RZI46087.1 23S rRNA (adenine(2503)-C(2))-methyltransferase RlmN [Candidatus Finniella inopinata]